MEAKLATIGDIAERRFDFVVVGGGTAGLTVASRLSENPDVTVAVLEAGKASFDDPNVLKPDGFMQQLMRPAYDWAFLTAPQKHLGDKVMPWFRGKGLGGSSRLNFLMWMTPQREDIDAFERLGNTGWNWETTRRYLEGIQRPVTDATGLGGEATGPIPLGYASTPSGAELPFQKSMNNNGIATPLVEDMATGQFEHNGSQYNVYVNKDVILSAGAVKSPQILELSGIGSYNILSSQGIPVKVDLPGVGENLRDKVTISITLEMKEGHDIFSFNLMANPEFHPRLNEIFPDTAGDFSSVISGMTFVPIQALPDNIQSTVLSSAEAFTKNAKQQGLYTKVHELLGDHLKSAKIPDFEVVVTPFVPSGPDPKKPYISLVVCLSHPFSSGNIHIQSQDPKMIPLIDPHVFENSLDLDILVEAFKFTRQVVQTAPFCDVVSKEINPGLDASTDDQIKAAIQKNLATIWHSSGTLSMLPKQDGGVVDSKLKVYGTTNIRVVDMSIVPAPISSHTQAIVYAMAEQAVDIIRKEFGL
ncbi:GMC oxidoreductase [Fomitopsis serialis]|uniref:GMC oxidoreductase n=1 Tax=Fomitopsis serialis TaxID=139415 RepID=UPI002007C6FE|nr:GMC oxidoreductase [Neoantrodia serialis]KAH9922714.1 GMC oxidoreductase [Neoantrodia serialis]